MNRSVFPLNFIGATCLRASWGKCPEEIGSTLNLDKFVGEWYVLASTPVTANKLSKCGVFTVNESRDQTFTMRYTDTFNVYGGIDGSIMGTWQLEGSERILRPFKHIVVAADYSSYFLMVV